VDDIVVLFLVALVLTVFGGLAFVLGYMYGGSKGYDDGYRDKTLEQDAAYEWDSFSRRLDD
jgi:hypothetical protein